MLKLSIITINLNNAAGLKKTMESVFNQTSKDFEYIVIDGGSTDGSVAIVQQFNNSTIQQFTWLSEPDSGIYQAMNKGIHMAKGEYCQFINSGDWLVANNTIERMLNALTDCAIFYGNMLKVLSNGTIFYNKYVPVNTMLTFYGGSLNHVSAFIKRSLFDKYGPYDESLIIVSDWKFYLIAIGLNNEKVDYVDIDVTYFDMRGISNTNSTLDKSERRKVLIDLLPPNILADYDAHWLDIEQIKRIKRYKILWKIFWFVERCLFQIDKRKQKRKRVHLFYE
ncbi:MAG: glycosyltransferase family 2 protein [Bacteroidales bacterium]|jgi:glycosyltransferase involved in cell wall biosynthesis